jgi:phage terminase large subunit-like protein
MIFNPLHATGMNEPDEDVSLLTPEIEAEIQKALDRRKLDFYTPYPKQELFHAASKIPHVREILLMAGNQLGKTMSAGAQTAIWTTGQYPDWWVGRRYNRATNWWVGSPTGQTMREGPQRILLGEIGEWGTGMIPGRSIIDIRKATHGSSDQVESILVRHEPTGKISRLLLKTYDQGRIRWQGATIDGVWFDEEPPEDIYNEGRTRTVVLDGFVFLTFTPLLGMTEVVTRYLKEQPPGSIVIRMGIADAKHFSPERQAEIIAGYPEHEREARAQGEPILGSGRVFPVDAAELEESPIQIPDYWPRIGGLDIGWDHPTAVVWLAWDRDVDIVHVYDTYKLKEQTPLVHAAIIKKRGPWIPIAWPHDGHQHDKGSGKMIAQQYRNEGVLMLPTHATHKPEKGKKEGTGGYSLEAGVSEMLIRMQTGRWRVSSLCQDWFNEYKMYYRKDGQIVKKGDDLMSASRIALMMLRFAKVRVVRDTAPVLPGFVQTDSGMGVLG